MLLAVDVGNTNLTLGVFRGAELLQNWRLKTDPAQTTDGWAVLFRTLFSLSKISIEEIKGVVIASVAPQLEFSLEQMARRYFGVQPLWVTHECATGLTLRFDNPAEVGADRIANSVAAVARYGPPCIVVDFGTAITFDPVSANREYLGGVICPGISISSEALFRQTARLPRIDVRKPARVIGSNTVAGLQSGLYYGMLGLVDGVLERMIAEMGDPRPRVIATGGQAAILAPGSKYIEVVDENLTLEGLRIVWESQGAAAATSVESQQDGEKRIE